MENIKLEPLSEEWVLDSKDNKNSVDYYRYLLSTVTTGECYTFSEWMKIVMEDIRNSDITWDGEYEGI